MNSKRLIALMLIVIMLSGCAAMSEEECAYFD
jgi:uncharacterized protein YceK